MPSLIDIRRRIRSVRNMQQITKAMKMVSAAKLRRAQERVIASRPYGGLLKKLLANVAAAGAGDDRMAGNPLLASRAEGRVQLILITADRGLAGAFNSNLIKGAQRFIEEHPQSTIEIEAVGRKGRDFFRKRNYSVTGEYIGMTEKIQYTDAVEVALQDHVANTTHRVRAVDRRSAVGDDLDPVHGLDRYRADINRLHEAAVGHPASVE